MSSSNSPKCGVVWMHGLGDTEAGWSSLKSEIPSVNTKNIKCPIKWVFPRAPTAGVACNGGMQMTSWFDIDDIPVTAKNEKARSEIGDVSSSIDKVHSLISKLEKEDGIPGENIFVGGFSQGGAIAMLAALKYPKKLGGAVSFSGWVLEKALDETSAISEANKGLPILWWHGDKDQVVSFPLQDHGVALLEKKGIPVSKNVQAYMAHSASPKQMTHLGQWLGERLESN